MRGPPRVIDHDKVLSLWQQKFKAREIAEEVGAKRRQTITSIIRRYRQKGDERAERRNMKFLPMIVERFYR